MVECSYGLLTQINICTVVKTSLPEGHAVFPGHVGQGKNTVCACLRASAVNLDLLANPVDPVKYKIMER